MHKTQELNKTQKEVFDLMVGFEEEQQISRKKLATRRALKARREIERLQEEKELSSHITECWFEEDE